VISALYNTMFVGNAMQEPEVDGNWYWEFDHHNGTQGDAVSVVDPPGEYGWRTVNLNGTTYHYGQTAVLRPSTGEKLPTFYSQKLLNKWVREGDRVISVSNASASHNGYPDLQTYGVKHTDGSLGIMVVNRAPSTDYAGVTIALNGFTANGGTAWSWGKANDSAAQTGSGNPDLTSSNVTASGSTFTASFPSYSMTLIQLNRGAVVAAPRAINCGGGAAGSFAADQDFTGGSTTTNDPGGIVDTSAVTNPAPTAVYRSERYGSAFSYSIPGLTAGAKYEIRLHFTEDYDTAVGQRLEDVTINGAAALTNFDIFRAAAAQHKANIQELTAVADGGGRIVIAFTAVPGHQDTNAKVDGIEVTDGTSSSFTGRDIGSVAVAGSDSLNGGVYTVKASGDDIWGTADSFRYVYRQLTGDGSITARVASLADTNGWAKAGVMMRNGLGASDVQVSTLVPAANATVQQYRSTSGGSSASVSGPKAVGPYWVRLTRTGNAFASSVSPDGVTWTEVGSATLTMNETVYVGLAASSHDNAVLTTATFDHVKSSP
jgi:regulation of enolase protein 1 (concanavalin A-like superfamily)